MMMMMTITVRSYLLTLNTNTLLPITSLNINMVKLVPIFNDTQTIPIYRVIFFTGTPPKSSKYIKVDLG